MVVKTISQICFHLLTPKQFLQWDHKMNNSESVNNNLKPRSKDGTIFLYLLGPCIATSFLWFLGSLYSSNREIWIILLFINAFIGKRYLKTWRKYEIIFVSMALSTLCTFYVFFLAFGYKSQFR